MEVALYHVKPAGEPSSNGAPDVLFELAGTRMPVELEAPKEAPLDVRFAAEYQIVVPDGPPATLLGLLGPAGLVATWQTKAPAPPGSVVTVDKGLRVPMPRVVE